MGKVIRSDRKGVQRIRARDIVPGDIVEVAGMPRLFLLYLTQGAHPVVPPFCRCLCRGWGVEVAVTSLQCRPSEIWLDRCRDCGQGVGVHLRDQS